jgi:DNA repair exonuclease SbcCD ATPase subunit
MSNKSYVKNIGGADWRAELAKVMRIDNALIRFVDERERELERVRTTKRKFYADLDEMDELVKRKRFCYTKGYDAGYEACKEEWEKDSEEGRRVLKDAFEAAASQIKKRDQRIEELEKRVRIAEARVPEMKKYLKRCSRSVHVGYGNYRRYISTFSVNNVSDDDLDRMSRW